MTLSDPKADLFGVGLTMVQSLLTLFPDFAPTADFPLSFGRRGIAERLKADEPVVKIRAEAQADCEKFKKLREKYLLY